MIGQNIFGFPLKYQNNNILIAIILSLFVLFSRMIFAEQYFLGYDPVNFVLGSISFSLANTRPHLPGYYLYVKTIQYLSLFFNDKHTAFLTVNYVFTFFAALFSYLSFRNLFNIKISILILLLLSFNPMVWYYGSVTEIYVFDWFLASVLLFIYFKKNGWYLIFPVMALGAGFRQSSGVLLIPFGLYVLFIHLRKKDVNYKYLFFSFFVSIALFAFWFFPMVSDIGGFSGYIALYSVNNPVEKISLFQSWFRMSSLLFFFVAPLILLIFAILLKIKQIKFKSDAAAKFKLLISMALFPLLFFIFVHYSKGYLLLIVLPVFAIIGIFIEAKIFGNFIIVLTIILEIFLFVFLPYHQESVVSLIRPEIRKETIFALWLDRTFSNYSLTQARIKGESDKVKELSELIKKAKSNAIFVDPTLSYYTRIFQYYFRGKIFLTLDLHNTERMILFSNLNVYPINRDNINIRSIPVLTRNDFLKKYMNTALYKTVITKWGFSIIEFNKKNNWVCFYEKLFSRSK